MKCGCLLFDHTHFNFGRTLFTKKRQISSGLLIFLLSNRKTEKNMKTANKSLLPQQLLSEVDSDDDWDVTKSTHSSAASESKENDHQRRRTPPRGLMRSLSKRVSMNFSDTNKALLRMSSFVVREWEQSVKQGEERVQDIDTYMASLEIEIADVGKTISVNELDNSDHSGISRRSQLTRSLAGRKVRRLEDDRKRAAAAIEHLQQLKNGLLQDIEDAKEAKKMFKVALMGEIIEEIQSVTQSKIKPKDEIPDLFLISKDEWCLDKSYR
mmetsp:Transcript_18963/g.24407  ORF Transcript_18963/g.24407 Transcript_18963/m.24407 type:complete len:268 (-) Transcript_18963:151-954(-)